MRRSLWPDSKELEVDEVLRRPSSDGIVVVAERDGGGLMGFAEIGLRKFADGCHSSPVAYLEGIWVDPDTQRDGVATALVRRAERWARSVGMVELGSDCELHNEASRKFHVAVGFEEVQRSICFKRDLTQGQS